MEEQEKEVGKDNVEEKAAKKQKKSSSTGSGKRKVKGAEWQIPNYAGGVDSTTSVLPAEKMDIAIEIPVWKQPITFPAESSSTAKSSSSVPTKVRFSSSVTTR